MAVSIAQLGGIGVLPASQSIEEQCALVDRVKRFKAGFQVDLMTLSPDQPLAEVTALIARTGYTTFPVTDNGLFHGRLLGVLTDKDYDPRTQGHLTVSERMRKDVQVGTDLENLEEANQIMTEYGRGFLPIVSPEGTLQSVVFKKDRDKNLSHPEETVGDNRRLRVAAAVSTHPEDRERILNLLAHQVDVLLIDASDGHTAFQADTLDWIKQRSKIPVIAGNVVTASGFDFLVQAGADAVKVGMGIGSGCTTQQVKATGRGQATALWEISKVRDAYQKKAGLYIPVIADGGIATSSEIVVALSLGADSVMLGNLFARFSESAGRIFRSARGEVLKEYWMEGSLRAHNHRRYQHTFATFFEEGIEGWVPHAGSIYDGLPILALKVQAALATAGCRSIDDLHQSAVLELQSPTSTKDNAINGMTPLRVEQR
jgi:IMP dehydrogenase